MDNPLIVHYLDIKRLHQDCHLNDNFIKLYNKFCPGPITFILKLKKSSKISRFVTNNQKSLAVRFPKHSLLRKLLKNLDYPLAAPSANISTRLSPVKKSDVVEEFGSKVKFILNGGRCKIGLESTIINIIKKPEILRFGGLDILKIEKVLNKKALIKINSKNKISPGQFPLHYSPGIPIRINAKKPIENEAFVLIKKKRNNSKNYYYLSKTRDFDQAAKNLYSTLRKIKKKGYKKIAVEKIPNTGLGKTINDRLNRAAKY